MYGQRNRSTEQLQTVPQKRDYNEQHSVSQIKIQNIYDTHHEQVKQPNKAYRNMQSTQEFEFKSEKIQYKKNIGKNVSNLLQPEPNHDIAKKVVHVAKKPVGIKTFKHDSSGTRLGFAEVEVKPAANRTTTNFWVDEGKGRSPVRNTKTWTTSKEFQLGGQEASSPKYSTTSGAAGAGAGTAGKKMFGFGKNENSKNINRPSAVVDNSPKPVPKVQIDIAPNSIVNVMSGDPFKKSFDARTQKRQESVNKVRENFQRDIAKDKHILQDVEHRGLSII